MLEVQGRATLLPLSESTEDTVQIRREWSPLLPLGLVSVLILLVSALVVFEGTDHVLLAWSLMALSGFGVWLTIYWWRTPMIWADRSTLIVRSFLVPFYPRIVMWSRIATCEIETTYDNFGQPEFIRILLKEDDGQAVLLLMLFSGTLKDSDRLIKFIKARLPKTKVDLWE